MSKSKVAATALSRCLKTMQEAAAPWKVPGEVVERVRALFETDFDHELGSAVRWKAWTAKALRLAKYVGAFAAFLAERDAGVGAKPSSVEEHHVLAAVAMVQDICPPPQGTVRTYGRLCAGVKLSPMVRAAAGAVLRGAKLKATA